MKRSAVLLIAVIAACGSTMAQTGNRDRPSFDALDKNRDGRLAPDEAQANGAVAAGFAAADKNGDGYLSRAEFLAHFERQF